MKAKAQKIALKSRKQVFGALSGNNISAFRGEGFEFSELREYIYGDDIRTIDWKTTAKLGKPYVKVYHEERELNVVVSIMLGGSTFFGVSKPKSEYIVELMAILGYSAIRNKDNFSHILYADKLYRYSKPSKKIFAVNKEVEEALEFHVLKKPSNLDGWVEELNKRVRKKSLLFLIGDFVGEINLSLLAKKHDLVLLIVRDHFIENPKPMGEVTLIDPGYMASFRGNFDSSSVAIYKAALKQNDKELYNHLRKIGARFAKFYTHEDPYLQLIKRL